MPFIYYIWILLPLAFIFLTFRAYFRKWTGDQKRENPKVLLSQAIFCSIALVLTRVIDNTIFPSIIEMISFEMFDVEIARWVLYPVILVALAYLQDLIGLKLFSKKKK